jgi:hypothetical protein
MRRARIKASGRTAADQKLEHGDRGRCRRRLRPVRGIAAAAFIALIAVPAIALAAGEKGPPAGPWTASFGSNAQLGGFVLEGGVKSLTFSLPGENSVPASCPTGSVTVSGPLALRYYKNLREYEFGKPEYKHHRVVSVKPVPVSATLDGQRLSGATLTFEFSLNGSHGTKFVRATGLFDPNNHPKCEISLPEYRPTSDTSGG